MPEIFTHLIFGIFSLLFIISIWRIIPKLSSKGRIKFAGILLSILGILCMLSLLTYSAVDYKQNSVYGNWLGYAGAKISKILLNSLGFGSFIVSFIISFSGVHLVFNIKKQGFGALLISSTGVLLVLISLVEVPGFGKLFPMLGEDAGGLVGSNIAELLIKIVGVAGAYVILLLFLICEIILMSDVHFLNFIERISPYVLRIFSALFKLIRKISPLKYLQLKNKQRLSLEKVSAGFNEEKTIIKNHSNLIDIKKEEVSKQIKEIEQNKVADDFAELKIKKTAKPVKKAPKIEGEVLKSGYKFPPLTLLTAQDMHAFMPSEEELKKNAKILEEKLADFGISGKVGGINPGPIITQYEVKPSPGVKINRIVNLADDLAMAMKALRIRIVAPIPGKSVIGVEIPNSNPSIVYLSEILSSHVFQENTSPLLMGLGKSISGEAVVANLADMPHLLIAGATGTGKSVCLNSIILSFIYRNSPDDLKLLLIDPKILELTLYNGLPHLVGPVITDPGEVSTALNWLIEEMEVRYQKLAGLGVRNISSFNHRLENMVKEGEGVEELNRLPYIVVVIDELADLMLTVAQEVEEPIARLAQMARAVGIHLILATQRPSVNVITGVIKANFPSRIAFQTASKIDSRTIIDSSGSEKLLGKGDMLFQMSGKPELHRVHGAYVDVNEIKRIVDFISSQNIETSYKSFGDEQGKIGSGAFKERGRDPMFDEALKLVVMHQQGSISLIQRRLKVGYSRAARIVDELEDAGIVGPFDGSKAREVLVDESYLEELSRTDEKNSVSLEDESFEEWNEEKTKADSFKNSE